MKTPVALICLLSTFAFSATVSVWASETKSNYEKVLLLTATDDKQALLRACAVCLKENAKDVDVLAISARTNLEIDHLPEAFRDAERALAIEPATASALTTRGYCLIQKKEYKKALVDYEAATKTQEPIMYVPIVEVNFGNLAALYRMTGQKKLAAETERKAKLETLLRHSCETRESGAVDQTIRLLTVVLTEQPNFHRARLMRAVTYSNKGDHRLAIKDFDYLIKAFPQKAWFYYLRADAYSELGEKENSVRDLLAITNLKIKPRVVALNYTAQTGRVREHFEGKDENIVNLADIYYLLGARYVELGKLALARAAYDRCLALDANEVQVRLYRADISRKMGNNAAALQDLNLAILANPKFIDAYLERAKLKDILHDSSALSDYSTVIAQAPKDPGSYLMRAEYYKHKKRFAESISDFSKALQLNPKEADAFVGRGESYEGMNRWSLALDDYRKALSLSPEDRVILTERITRLLKLTGKTGR